jgi:hypothetical protein
MGLQVGNTEIGTLYLGSTKVSSAYLGNVKVYEAAPVLPSYTMRLKFTEGVTPTFGSGTAVQVSSSPNVWDFTYENASWQQAFYNNQDLIAVLGANIVGVTNLTATFFGCRNLAEVALFDTSTVTTFSSTFRQTESLRTLPLFDTSNATSIARICESSGIRHIPLLDTSKATNVRYAFNYCITVESGALALYNQMSTQSVPPTTYEGCFEDCGEYTPPGTPIHAERAQIPESWGGTMAE